MAEKKNEKAVAIMTAIIGIAILFAFASTSDSGSSEPREPGSQKLLAYNLAADCVKSRLKSPSSAKFASSFSKKEHVTHLGDDRYKVQSYVDSQNGFGAMIRSHWTVTIKLYGSSSSCESVVVY